MSIVIRCARLGLWLFIVAVCVLLSNSASAQNNFYQTALLRWYGDINGSSFAVGTNPVAVAFDGSSIWVASYNGFKVTKLRASDGASVTINLGANLESLAYDGLNMWVTEGGSNSVAKIRASDGALLGTFPVGNFACGVAFDGSYIWVSNSGANTVSKLRTDTGAIVGTYAVGASPCALAHDGANIWVVNQGGNSVTKLRSSDGTKLATIAVGYSPVAIAYDGSNNGLRIRPPERLPNYGRRTVTSWAHTPPERQQTASLLTV